DGRRLIPAERRPRHVPAFLAHRRIEPQPHFVGAFGGQEQHAALPLDHAAEERLRRHKRSGELERDEALVGAPLSSEQAVAAGGNQPLHQPTLEWAHGSSGTCCSAASGEISTGGSGLPGSGCGGSGCSALACQLLLQPPLSETGRAAALYLRALRAISRASRPSCK